MGSILRGGHLGGPIRIRRAAPARGIEGRPPRRCRLGRPARSALSLLGLVALALGFAPAGASAEGDSRDLDAFAEGYATAVIERELGSADARVTARDGVLTVWIDDVPATALEKLERSLERVEGVRRVEIVEGEPPPDVAAAEPASAASAAPDGEPEGTQILPPLEVFDPLLADPRWPHFGASYQRYSGDEELESVGAVSFGEAIPLLGLDGPFEGHTQIGLHAAVFSIFDLDTSSFDLVNSDFLVGVTGAWRRGDLSLLARLFHQSSHLGDEFLLRSRVDRVNLSYEQADLLLSYDLPYAFRVYAGGGTIVHANPDSLDRPSAQAGLEWKAPEAWADGVLRPLAAVDVKSWAETDWDPDLSARAGFQVESAHLLGQRLQILLEYYDGRSPNGQFFERDVRWYGLGTHLHF